MLGELQLIRLKKSEKYMDVLVGDRALRIYGTVTEDSFTVREDSICEWRIPEGKPVSDEERWELTKKIADKMRSSGISVAFI